MATTQGVFQSLRPTFEYGTPIMIGNYYKLGNMSDEVTAYSHTNSAFIGFDSANITIAGSTNTLEQWYIYGLGRDIRVFGSEIDVIWEGFVNQVVYTIGALTMTIGPLLNIANRVSVRYSEVVEGAESVNGTSMVTIIQEDSDSQALYGILEQVLSAGSLYMTQADQVCSVFLQDKKYPPSSINYSFGRGGTAPNIKLDCRGYGHLLDAYIYENTSTGVTDAATKVEDVIDADPNSIILNKEISANASLSSDLEDQYRTGLSIIKECANLGDGSDNRWLFGVYEDRTAVFAAVPTTVEYIHELADEKQLITSNSGSIVKPWSVRAGKWIESRDVPVAYAPLMTGEDIRSDLRTTFIETVTFTMPYQLNISGTGIDKAPQAIAKYGIGAIV